MDKIIALEERLLRNSINAKKPVPKTKGKLFKINYI